MNRFQAETHFLSPFSRGNGSSRRRDGQSERARLEAERDACQRNLHALDMRLDSLAEEVPAAPEPVEQMAERLSLIAAMGADVRTPLHRVLGGLQKLRLDPAMAGGAAVARLDSILDSGRCLLGLMHELLDLADLTLPLDRCVAWPDAISPAMRVAPPAMDAPDPGLMPGAASAAHGDGTVLDILVVDDVAANRDSAAGLLRVAGHRVSIAEGGMEAVEIASAQDFDVILMDVRMPVLDGLEATRRIRELRGARGTVPIVALTSMTLVDDIERCREAGMNGHVAKPFRQDTLLDVVSRAAQGHARAGAQAGAANSAGGVVDIAAFRGKTQEPTGQWLKLDESWNALARASRALPSLGVPARQNAAPFRVQLRPVKDALDDGTLTCTPPLNQDQQEFHWLVHVNPDLRLADTVQAACDLWRWHRSCWRSIAVPGVQFTSAEMYAEGWRYCGPCDTRSARLELGASRLHDRQESGSN